LFKKKIKDIFIFQHKHKDVRKMRYKYGKDLVVMLKLTLTTSYQLKL